MSTFEQLDEADLELREEPASRTVYYGMQVLTGLGLAAAAALAAQELPHYWQSAVAISVAFAEGALLYQWVQSASGVLGAQRHLCVFMALVAWMAPFVCALVSGVFVAGILDAGVAALLLVPLAGPFLWAGAVGAFVFGRAAFRRLHQYEVSGGNGEPATLMLTLVPMLAIVMLLAGAWEKGSRRQREIEAAERYGQGRPGEAELSPEARRAADPNANHGVRRRAVDELVAAYDAEKATDDLLWLLNDPEVRERMATHIYQNLGEVATPRAKQALLDAISRFPDQAEAAADELVRAECLECIPELVRLLDGPCRLAAAKALGELRAWEATPAFIRAVERETDDRTRGSTLNALANVGGERAFEAVRRAVEKHHGRLGGHHEEVLLWTARERAHLGPPPRALYDVE